MLAPAAVAVLLYSALVVSALIYWIAALADVLQPDGPNWALLYVMINVRYLYRTLGAIKRGVKSRGSKGKQPGLLPVDVVTWRAFAVAVLPQDITLDRLLD